MISALVFVLSLVILGLSVGAFKFSTYLVKSKYGDNVLSISKLLKLIGIVIVSAVFAAFQPIGLQKIDSGSVGLKINRIGNSKGIPQIQPVKGYVFYNAWITDVVEYSIKFNHVKYEPFQVTTKGGFPITVQPSFNYQLKADKAGDLYINLLKGNDFRSLEDNFIKTATELSLNNASNKFPVDSIFNNKEGYNNAITLELNRELSNYFIVNQINPGSVPPKELADVIKAKTETIQKAQQAELDKITAQAEAETKIARAKGDSASLVINAQAEAEAIKIKQREITPTYVEYIKWTGASSTLPRVPSTVLGSGANYLLSGK